jgi:predicted aspartyl protease
MRVQVERRESDFGYRICSCVNQSRPLAVSAPQHFRRSGNSTFPRNSACRTVIVTTLFLFVVITGSAAKRSDALEIPFTLYRNHLVVTEGILSGQAKRNVLIDTGTNVSIIDTAAADELGLQRTATGNVTVVDGVTQTYFAVLPNIELGPMHRENLMVAVSNLSWLRDQTGIRVDAVIGVDALETANFQIDYASRKIHFGPVRIPRSAVPILQENGLLTIRAELNGTPAKLLVDTGGSALILFAGELPQANEWETMGTPIRMSNLAGHTDLRQVQLNEARIGKVNLSGSLALVAGNATCCHLQGVLGISQVQFKRVTFDFARRLVGFELQNSFLPLQNGNLAAVCCNAADQSRMIRAR